MERLLASIDGNPDELVYLQATPDGRLLVSGLSGSGASSSTQTAHYTVSAANAYTLPSLPSTLAGARILFNGVEYADNGVDWSVSGLTLTVINTSISDAIGTEFKFQWS